ncbi:helix-turn-helix domain-containing protein [Parafrankia discariae]|uniref:hypothetical protein n=1 Tax=Parafrankia discariae TaxID=365528 RepID=UPI0018A8491E|nr:hypothetical protein [Parafrankia discariae]
MSRPRWEDAVYAQMSTPTGKAVVLRLARHMKWGESRPGRDGEPGNARLAAEVGVSERQVQRCLDEARIRGLIEMTRRHNNRRSGHPQAAYAARMPSVPALPMPVDAPPASPSRPDTDVRSSAPAPALHDRTSVSGREADDRTPMSGSTHKNLRELLPPDPPLTQAAIMVGVPSSSGSPIYDQTIGADDEIDAVLGTLADTLPVSTADRAVLAGALRIALATPGWEPVTLADHLLAELPAVIRTRGLMNHRLSPTVLPDSPAVCPCTACRRHVRQTEAEIRRQAAAAERARHRATAATDDTAARNQQITSSLGPALHGRILTAADQAEYAARLATTAPNAPRPTPLAMRPGRARGLAAEVYATHAHDLARIRAYAEALPPGPAESAQDDTTTPTPTGHAPTRLRRAEGA